MAKFLALIYGDEATWEAWTEEEDRRNGEAHAALIGASGPAVRAVHEVQRSSTARSIRAGRDGEPLVTVGPFVETREAIGGFYILEAADLDDAVALAARIPEATAPGSGVEVRPMVEPSGEEGR